MPKYLFDKNRINNEQKILNHLLIQQRHLKKTLYSYLEKISKDILDIPKHESSETLISCINEIQNIYENTKLNITTILDLKNLLENVSRSKHLSTFDFEKYTSQFFELFDKISNTNIEYYSFMEKLQKYMHLYFSGDEKNPFQNSLDNKDILDDIINEDIIDDNNFASSDTPIIEDLISENLFENDSKDIIDELLKDAIFETIPEEIIDNDTSDEIDIIEENKNIDIASDDVDDIQDDNNTDIISDDIENNNNNNNNDEDIVSDIIDNIECNNNEESSNNTLINETISINLLKELIEDVVGKAVEKVISDTTETTKFNDSIEEIIDNNDYTEEIETIEVTESDPSTSDEPESDKLEINISDEEIVDEAVETIDSNEEIIDETIETSNSDEEIVDETIEISNSNEEIIDETIETSNSDEEIIDETIETSNSDEEKIENNDLRKKEIETIEVTDTDSSTSDETESDNNSVTPLIEKTLFIFSSTETAILPYSISELENCFSNNPENYSSIQDIIDKEYTVSLENYRNSSLARYQEAFKLAKEKSDLTLTDSINFARKFVFEEQVTPLIIASCTNVNDLNNYLDCLNNNILNEFNCFKIIEK